MTYEIIVQNPYMVAPNCVQRSETVDAVLKEGVPFSLCQHVYDLENRVVKLTNQVTAAEEAAASARRAHHKDIEIIGDRLILEAEERGWCSVYDDVIAELNNDLRFPLTEREHDYEVEFEVTARLTVNLSGTTSDAVIEHAEDMLRYLDGNQISDFTVSGISIDSREAQQI